VTKQLLGQPPRGAWRRSWVLRVCLPVAALACLAVGYLVLSRSAAEGRLRAAIAELDRTDPGWRLEDLEAARAPVTDDENGALVVLRAAALMGKSDGSEALDAALHKVEPPAQLDPDLAARLDANLNDLGPALAEARKLADFSTGRFLIRYGADGYSTPLPHLEALRSVEYLLELDARRSAHHGEMAAALHSARALAGAGRCVGDEPLSHSQILRGALVFRAAQTTEYVLSQGEGTEEELAALQRLLEEELGHPAEVIAERGERALGDRFLSGIASGAFTVHQVTWPGHAPTISERLQAQSDRQGAPALHARFLADVTQRVKHAQVPPADRPGPFHDPYSGFFCGSGLRSAADFIKVVSSEDNASSFQSQHARVTCGVVLVAAERFRLARHRWPATADELVPAYLAQVPRDPYYGKPILLRRVEDGLVVYSVGPDGWDDGGQLEPDVTGAPAPDLGLRLWDVDRRRQPPRPPAELPPGERVPAD
jgi:hypothetical protein